MQPWQPLSSLLAAPRLVYSLWGSVALAWVNVLFLVEDLLFLWFDETTVSTVSPPALISVRLPLTYNAGRSFERDQVRHTECHWDRWRLIGGDVHCVPNNQTTKRPRFPSKPSSAHWTSGWRYMKAIHCDFTGAWRCLIHCYFVELRFRHLSHGHVITFSFRLRQSVNSCNVGMETSEFSLQWLQPKVKSATFPQRLSRGADGNSIQTHRQHNSTQQTLKLHKAAFYLFRHDITFLTFYRTQIQTWVGCDVKHKL